MNNVWLASDHHLSHARILEFTKKDGSRLREFDSVDQMNEMMLERHNAIVHPKDRVYFLGDVVINRKYLHLISKFNGRKVLVRGNHDIFHLGDYTPYFDDICGTRKMGDFVLSHVPIHPDSIPKWCKANIHGHLHSEVVMLPDGSGPDERYINVSMERIDYTPVNLESLVKLTQ